ncbi:MAG TPA: HDIG domain-containing protein [Ignavibacteria bacterium]|nr:HDIG domain-containing protein [Ignavibacteria bacterium]
MIEKKTKTKLRHSLRIRILIVLTTIILIVMMFPRGESLEFEVSVGSIWIQDDLIASTTFEVLKDPEVYRREVQQAVDKVYPIFILEKTTETKQLDSIKSYSSYLEELFENILKEESPQFYNPTFLSDDGFRRLLNLKRQENLIVSQNRIRLQTIFRTTEQIVERVYRRGFLSEPLNEIKKDTITIRDGKFERDVPKRNYLDDESAKNFLQLFIRNNLTITNELAHAVEEYTYHFLKPNIIYSQSITEEAIERARNKVSRNVGIVNENERIVAKHDRVTADTKLKIDSYKIAKGESTGFWGNLTQNIGKFLHIVIILLLFSIYIYLFRKKIYHDNVKILLIAIIILIISGFAYLVQQIVVQAPIEYLILVPVGSMLLTIIFDSRVGFYGTVMIALIAGGLRGNDYAFAVMNIVAGGLAAYTVRDIKNRSQIFRSFLFILTGYVISILAFGLERFSPVEQILIHSGFAASNALISPVLTYGLIIFFERIFKITTDLTLLELTDFNSPLLKQLATKAPGTFTHSMTIGSLVETAAIEIGANPILSRVGAYYHDIGKSFEPASFVENQLDDRNVHEKLNPQKSAQLIIDHVKKGIELAKENNLPQDIIDFIPMHHGTMLVSFFYEKAKKEIGEENVNEEDFRYPGPKPNTKEAALLMLADACESAIRSMTESDPKKIENIINNLIKQRLEDGQLDEAPITLKDIKKIKEAFASILVGQHHKRIRYPKQDEMEENE